MFGITNQDVEMQDKIQRAGLTVDQAYEMRRNGTLPKDLSDSLDQYEAYLKSEADKAENDE